MQTELDYIIVEQMEKYGGSFVKALAECFHRADRNNFEKLKKTFAEYWEEYRKMSGTTFKDCPDCSGFGFNERPPACKDCLPMQEKCETCNTTGMVDENYCERCGDTGVIEELGDGENFEVDVIGYKPCPDCNNQD